MVTVFQNIQCTFSVEFTVSNVNIAKYISSSQQSMNYNISLCDIKISKLNINQKEDSLVIEYNEQMERLDRIYTNMELCASKNNKEIDEQR